jgi:hypothetical protein
VKDRLSLRLQPCRDAKLDCIVCRRVGVDMEIVYGINGGRASQGIHRQCVGRAEAIQGGARFWRRPTSATTEVEKP